MKKISVHEFYQQHAEELSLSRLTEVSDGPLAVSQPDLNRPGLVLAGYTETFLNERIQILGEVEQAYLGSLSEAERRVSLERLFSFPMPCVILTHSAPSDPALVDVAESAGVPVFLSSMSTTTLQHELSFILDDAFSPELTMHGTLVDVYGVGLLFTGRAAIGKSECALDLVERGHRLVADDQVTIQKTQESLLIGKSNAVLTHHVEIRGVGIIDVRAIFGIRAVRGQKRVEVEVNLRDWDSSEDYERLGLEGRKSRILGVEVPLVEVPIFPGKNITVIAEVIAMNYLVKAHGYDPAQAFSDRLLQTMEQKRMRFESIARGDRE